MILEQGVQEKDLIIVREVPFSMSMKKSFEIGLERGKKWTFCIDADVLLRKHSIQKMIQFAENQKKNVCEIQGLVLDKFFSGPRGAEKKKKASVERLGPDQEWSTAAPDEMRSCLSLLE